MKGSIVAALGLFLISSHSWAWGALGHSIVGEVAAQRMNPETKAYVAGLMGLEPVAFTATWADAVRDDDLFGHDTGTYDQDKKDKDDNNFSDYHFVDIPTGFTYDSKPVKDVKDSFGALNGAIQILEAPKSQFSKQAKMIALRYIVHLVGDIHQPLHVGNGYDIGANFCSVYWKQDKFPVNLHQVWDGMIVSEVGNQLIDTNNPKAKPVLYYPDFIAAFKAKRASKFNQDKPQDTSVTAIKNWLNETAAVRETSIYPDTDAIKAFPVNEKYKHRPYCMWLSDKKKNVYGDTSPKSKKDIPDAAIPRLGQDYINANAPVAEDQLIKGGVRLAALLDRIAADVAASKEPQKTLNADEQQALVKSIQGVFHNE
jgi:hypothetical protein